MNNVDKKVIAFGAGNYYMQEKDLISKEYNIIAFAIMIKRKLALSMREDQ